MKRLAIIAAFLVIFGCVLLYLWITRSPGNWRQVSLSFSGYTNSMAVISIHNMGPSPVVLRDRFMLEFAGVAPHSPFTGSTNLLRSIPTGTNLVVAPSGRADFLIPIPAEGQSWIARLEFAPAGAATRVKEYMMRQPPNKYQWRKFLPLSVRGVPVYTVSQQFSK